MPGTATLCSLSEVIKAVPTAVNYKHTNTELVVSNELCLQAVTDDQT